jgi:hypothetical protein
MNALGAPDSYLVGALVNAVVGCVTTVISSAVIVYIALVVEEWHTLSHRAAGGGRHNAGVPLAGRW